VGAQARTPDGSTHAAVLSRHSQHHTTTHIRPTLLPKVQAGELKPSLVVTHILPLTDAPKGYQLFNDKKDGCVKVGAVWVGGWVGVWGRGGGGAAGTALRLCFAVRVSPACVPGTRRLCCSQGRPRPPSWRPPALAHTLLLRGCSMST
jgi:hypothetical protein